VALRSLKSLDEEGEQRFIAVLDSIKDMTLQQQ
jgi:hypothetical protein